MQVRDSDLADYIGLDIVLKHQIAQPERGTVGILQGLYGGM